MKTTEQSVTGKVAASVAARVKNAAMDSGIERGVKAAMEYLEHERKQLCKGRQDRRLRNTKLLLRNYRDLKTHVTGAIFSARQAKESAIDILDGLDSYDMTDELYIESVKRSQQRTVIILAHIDEMIRYYRISVERSNRPEDMRAYRVIMAMYIEDEPVSVDAIAEQEHIERRTVYKDINTGVRQLSALIFGIDSLRTV